jgi:Cytidine and deoxycytidylate deaminase zinc-binding region
MLIHEKLRPGHLYPQLSQAPIASYADFLNFFRGGHTVDNNTDFTTANTVHTAMFKTAIASGHLTKSKNTAIPDEFLADVSLTKSGSELIQTVLDRTFCEKAIAEARKSIAEDDGEPHPYVGAVIVKNGVVLATGRRGEKGKGDHAEYCCSTQRHQRHRQCFILQAGNLYAGQHPSGCPTAKRRWRFLHDRGRR